MKLPLYSIGFVFLCSLLGFSYGQSNHDLDSLENLISIQKDDTSKIYSLLILSKAMLKIDPEKANKYANQIQDLSKKLNYIEGEIDALYCKANAFKSIGSYDSSINQIKEAINLSDSIEDDKRLADNYLFYAAMLFRTNKLDSGKQYLGKSFKLYNVLHDSVGLANVYNLMGNFHKRNSRLDSAVYYYLKLIKASEEIGYLEGLGKGNINLGILYYQLEELESAKNYLSKSIEIYKQLNHLRYVGIAYNNLGSIADDEEQYDKAFEYYYKALDLYEKLNNWYGIANIYNNIANIHDDLKQYDQAFAKYSMAKEIYERIGDRDGIIAAFKNQAIIYERLKNYDKALIIYDSCLVLAREINALNRTKEIYYNIFKTYELKQDFKNAFYSLTEYEEIKDSIFNLEKAETIADLQLKYEKEKDQAHILSLEKENLEKDLSLRKRTNQRNIYLFSGLGIISVILFLLIFFRHKTRKDKIITAQRIQQLEEEKKLLAARSIVIGQEEERKRIAKELHDGLGVLLSTAKIQFTSIKDKSPENKPLIDKATQLLEQAAGDVRKISHNMMPGLLTRFGFYEAVEDLIEQLDETTALNATCEITGDTKRLSENTEIMLYRIVQEMVNNTLKHAQAKNISFNINVQTNQLILNYSDDGVGFNVNEKLESTSIGLTSIQSRVNFLNGKSQIESSPGTGTTYFIKIPI